MEPNIPSTWSVRERWSMAFLAALAEQGAFLGHHPMRVISPLQTIV